MTFLLFDPGEQISRHQDINTRQKDITTLKDLGLSWVSVAVAVTDRNTRDKEEGVGGGCYVWCV